MCGGWYFPMFLFNEGSLTLINMASLIFLVLVCDSLCMMVKQSGLTVSPVVLLCWWIGEGALRCSLTPSLNVVPDLPMYCSGKFIWVHVNLHIISLFCSLWSLSLRAIRSVLTVFVVIYFCIIQNTLICSDCINCHLSLY